jgi:hypothetical protein
MSTTAPPDPPLAHALAAARAHADRHFGDGPAPEWQPSGAATPGRWLPRPGRAWQAAGLLMVAVVLAAAWWAHERDGVAASTGPFEAGPADAEAPAPPLAPLPPPAAPLAPRPAAAAPAPVLNITRHGARWQIHAVSASRLAAATVLAELSGSTLHGNPAPLAATRPLDLRHWQGRSLAEAWQAVLGAEINYALQCDAGRCQAWIVGGGAPGAAPALPVAWPTAAAAAPAGAVAPAAVAPAAFAPAAVAAPAQSDSADPRVSSHHD